MEKKRRWKMRNTDMGCVARLVLEGTLNGKEEVEDDGDGD